MAKIENSIIRKLEIAIYFLYLWCKMSSNSYYTPAFGLGALTGIVLKSACQTRGFDIYPLAMVGTMYGIIHIFSNFTAFHFDKKPFTAENGFAFGVTVGGIL